MSERDRVFQLVGEKAWDKLEALLPSLSGGALDLARIYVLYPKHRRGLYNQTIPAFLEISRSTSDPQARAVVEAALGEAYEISGNLERAEAHYLGSLRANADPRFQSNTLNCLGGMALRSCMPSRARGFYGQSIDLAPDGATGISWIFSWIGMARTSIARGSSGQFAIEEARNLINSMKGTQSQAAALPVAEAEQAILEGNLTLAETIAKKSISTLEEYGLAGLIEPAHEALVATYSAMLDHTKIREALANWSSDNPRATGRKAYATALACREAGIPWGELIELPSLLSISNPGVRISALRVSQEIPGVPVFRKRQIREAIGADSDGLSREMMVELITQ